MMDSEKLIQTIQEAEQDIQATCSYEDLLTMSDADLQALAKKTVELAQLYHRITGR